ncbi:MAG: carbohydrate kinase family protein, partial [Candidatus Thermoplasmatota archaeon]|nr:carbohydrate kinase family protein [Candidatus Thermoplasmatota archaeon]MDA8143405.1 carbohydrate kinase family protein [Thermoplasmatales archaeon]
MQGNFLAFFGHLNIDVTMRVKQLPRSGSADIINFGENFGGTAGNFAIIASRLGVPFSLYSAVSKKTHDKYLEYLSQIGVDTSHIIVDNEDYGPVCYAVTTGKEQIYYIYQGPMGKPFSIGITSNGMDYEYIHLGTGPPDYFLEIGKKNASSKIVFDPGQELNYRYSPAQLGEFLKISYTTILNENEEQKASQLLGIKVSDLPDLCKNLIITRGSEGVDLYMEGNKRSFRTLKVDNPYDTLGAGDSFRAGLYLGLSMKMGLDEGIKLGIVVAAEAIKNPLISFKLGYTEIMAIYGAEREKLVIP